MINKNIPCYLTLTFRVSPLRGGLYGFCDAWQRCSQRLGMGRPGASHEGPRAAGIGQRRGCRDRVSWRRHPAAGSHLPAEGTAPPFAVAPFRVVAPCPAPQKPHTLPRPTAGFRIIPALPGNKITRTDRCIHLFIVQKNHASRRKAKHLAPPPDLMNSESGDAATVNPRDSSTDRNWGDGSFMTTRPPISTALAQNSLPSAGVSAISPAPKTRSRCWRDCAAKASGR